MARSLAISVITLADFVGDIYQMPYDLSIPSRRMHQTTVRFSAELWEALEEECARVGVSVAQFLREAALTRLAYAAGKRGDAGYERALGLVAGETPPESDPSALEAIVGTVDRSSASLRDRSLADFSDATALAAQGRMARQRSRELRDRRARRDRT